MGEGERRQQFKIHVSSYSVTFVQTEFALHLRIMDKGSSFAVGWKFTSCGISQTLYDGLKLGGCTVKIGGWVQFVTSYSTVFPAPFWPVMRVRGVPN